MTAGAILSAPGVASAQPPGGGGPSPVETGFVERGQIIEEVRLTGSVEALRFTQLSTDVAGRVVAIEADEGDLLQAGATLMQLRTTPTELLLAEQRATTAQYKAILDELLAGSRAEDIDVARAQLAEAEARLRLAESEKMRFDQLRAEDVVSDAEYEAVEARVASARAEVQREKAELAREEQGPRAEEIAAARAEYEAARAVVDQLEYQLERHTLTVPYDSVMGMKNTEIGEWVAPGDNLFAVADVSTLRAKIDVPERYFNDVAPGTPVTLTFDAAGGDPIETTVTRRVPLASQSSRTFPVLVDFDNEDLRVAPGMLARALFEIVPEGAPEGILVPKDAVVMNPDRSEVVWVVTGEGEDGSTVEQRNVVTGRTFRGFAEILEGNLESGDEVVVRGNENLRPGATVSVAEAPDGTGKS